MAMIPYTFRGEYFAPCQNLARKHQRDLAQGRLLIWRSGQPKGYAGDHITFIQPGTHFHAAFEYTDPSRFSIKLRHMATGLRDAGLMHIYHLTHDKGTITVQRIDLPAHGSSTPCILVPIIKTNDDWWRGLQDLLTRAMQSGIPFKKIIFRGGGKIPIPEWFKDWCKNNSIIIEILEPEEFERRFLENPLIAKELV